MCLNIFYFILSVLSLLEFKLSYPWLSTPMTALPQYYGWAYFTKLPSAQQHYVQLGYIVCNSRGAITWDVWIEINLLPYWKHGYHCTNFCETNNLSTNSVDSSYIEFYPNHIKNAEKNKKFHLCPYTNCSFHCTHIHKTQNCSITLHGHPPTPEFTQIDHKIQ